MKKLLLFISIGTAFLANSFQINAQCSFDNPPNYISGGSIESKNGWYLPTSGNIRILFVFYEVNYTGTIPDPTPVAGNPGWAAHSLPIWANEIADVNPPAGDATGVLTRYFQLASSGDLNVLGDYLLSPSNGGIFSVNSTTGIVGPTEAITAVNASMTGIITGNGLNDITDFDKWTITGPGLVKTTPSVESPKKYDHVMFICRNGKGSDGLGNNGTGFGSYSLPSSLLGFNSNTHSNFGAYDAFPFNIIRHEFSHFLYGDNRFHTAGGGWGDGPNYWIQNLVGGWSNMGLYGSSLNSWNAWDRQRLGWKEDGSSFEITARNQDNSSYLNGDINPLNPGDAGIYTLRDFVLYGDAIRIKLPFTDPINEYPEYIWIENHQGKSLNNVSFDKWQHEGPGSPCVDPLIAGLYCYIQIDKDIRSSINSNDVFGGYSDYLRPITADGSWDREYETTPIFNTCVSWNNSRSFTKKLSNPLSGICDQEPYPIDIDSDNILNRNDQLENFVEKNGNTYHEKLFAYGNSRHAFTLTGNNKISIGSNPSSASMMNLVSLDAPGVANAKNLRKIYLNGISVEILSQSGNEIKVQIRFDDVEIKNNIRWAADNIVLNPINTSHNNSLIINSGYTLNLDRSKTPSRLALPETFYTEPNTIPEKLFNSPTVLTVKPTAKIEMQAASKIIIENGSTLKLNNAAEINMLPNAHIEVKSNGVLELEAGSLVKLAENATILVHDGGKIIIRNGAKLMLQKNSQLLIEQDGVWGQGELVIENTQADFGISLGDISDGANTTECLINGKLTLGAGVDFTYKGSGFYTFGQYFNVNFTDPLSRIFLNGLHENNLLIKNQCNEIDFTNHDVIITNGTIEYGAIGLMQLANSQVVFEHLILNGNSDAEFFNAKNLKMFAMSVCQGYNLSRIGSISDAFPNSTMYARYSTFEDCNYGFSIDNVGDFTFNYVTMKRTKFTCISLNSARKVNLLSSQLIENNQANNAIEATDVIGLYMHGGIISESNTAILGTNTLVWLRMCATLENNLIGVELYGSKTGNPIHYSSMLTIGDSRSANVRKNMTAIKGSDFLLNIEPVRYNNLNAMIYKSPNNFSDNELVFDICYTEPKLFNEINARYNYWGADLSGVPIDIDPSNYEIKEKTFCGNASNYHTPVSIITSPFSNCSPNDCSINCTTYANGSSSPYFPTRLFDVETYLEARALIENEFLFANTEFMQLDTPSTRELFYYLSLIDLTKDAISGKWVDPDGNEYDEKLVERVNTAKVLIEGLAQNSRRQRPNFKKKEKESYFNETALIQNGIKIYPNPAKDVLNINYRSNKSVILFVEIFNSMSQSVSKFNYKFESGNNLKQFNIENLSSGIYTIKFDSNTFSDVKQFIKN